MFNYNQSIQILNNNKKNELFEYNDIQITIDNSKAFLENDPEHCMQTSFGDEMNMVPEQ